MRICVYIYIVIYELVVERGEDPSKLTETKEQALRTEKGVKCAQNYRCYAPQKIDEHKKGRSNYK